MIESLVLTLIKRLSEPALVRVYNELGNLMNRIAPSRIPSYPELLAKSREHMAKQAVPVGTRNGEAYWLGPCPNCNALVQHRCG